jgi:hypothetical protein
MLYTISECLTDPQIIMSWEILIQLEAQISKKKNGIVDIKVWVHNPYLILA